MKSLVHFVRVHVPDPADGRRVLFRSAATNIVDGDLNGSTDLFIRDVESDTTLALSAPYPGASMAGTANNHTGRAALSPSGSIVVFESLSSDLAPHDLNQARDIFVARLDEPPAGFRILSITRADTGETSLVWESTPGAVYRVQYRSEVNAGDWQTLPLEVTASGTTATAADPDATQAPRRFYRVEQQAP